MSRLIEAEETYRVLTEYYHHRTDAQHEALREALERVPSAQLYTEEEIQKMQDLEFAEIEKAYEIGLREGRKTGEWIPCSERLPSEDGSYIVTSSFGKVYTSHYYAEHGQWQYNRRGMIEAWMPLPEPYKGVTE